MTSALASIQPILAVEHHDNADSLDLVQCLGYSCIVKRDTWKVGDLAILILPDTVLPADRPWTAFYRAKSSRVKAVKLRGRFSYGIVESAANVGYTGPMDPGLDVTEALSITKYEAPIPQELNAKGGLPFGVPKSDEERWQSLRDIPYGEPVDVTLKIDGKSVTFIWYVDEAGVEYREICGRTLAFWDGAVNDYTQVQANHDVINRISAYCRVNGLRGLALRGECFGRKIQASEHNPHSKLPLGLALYSTWLIEPREYARKGNPLYVFDLAPQLGLPTVPVIEKDVILTRELIHKYDEELSTLKGQMFEGVVVQHARGSFKIINKHFDVKKA